MIPKDKAEYLFNLFLTTKDELLDTDTFPSELDILIARENAQKCIRQIYDHDHDYVYWEEVRIELSKIRTKKLI